MACAPGFSTEQNCLLPIPITEQKLLPPASTPNALQLAGATEPMAGCITEHDGLVPPSAEQAALLPVAAWKAEHI